MLLIIRNIHRVLIKIQKINNLYTNIIFIFLLFFYNNHFHIFIYFLIKRIEINIFYLE